MPQPMFTLHNIQVIHTQNLRRAPVQIFVHYIMYRYPKFMNSLCKWNIFY